MPIIRTAKINRRNIRKADWSTFQRDVDSSIQLMPACVKSYKKFTNILHNSAKKSIPRGFCKEYIPCWLQDTEELKRKFEDTVDPQIAHQIMHSLDSAMTKRWKETTEGLNLAHSSRKAATSSDALELLLPLQ